MLLFGLLGVNCYICV